MLQALNVKVKKLHKDAVIPTYAKYGDAGLDLTATEKYFDENGNICYGTGLAFEIPDGYVGLIFPRSSVSKKDLSLSNSVGVVDSGYRGEVTFKFVPTKPSYDINENYEGLEDDKHWRVSVQESDIGDYDIGDRIGQLIILPYPRVSLVEVQELSETERGDGGFGSSGT
jgi:dUTP pyrophosphatase